MVIRPGEYTGIWLFAGRIYMVIRLGEYTGIWLFAGRIYMVFARGEYTGIWLFWQVMQLSEFTVDRVKCPQVEYLN